MTTWRKAFGLFLIVMLLILAVGPVSAQDEDKDKPARGMVAALIFPGITIGPEDKVRIDLKVKNTGRSDEMIMFEVLEQPEGWKAQIKSYSDVIDGIFLTEDEDRSLTFTAGPEDEKVEKLPAGVYNFKVRAFTTDGALSQTSSLKVTVLEEAKTEDKIKLTTSYPVLRGPSDAKFEFSLDVSNESEEDTLFNLSSLAAEGWELTFKPAYEQKQISSLQIQANQSKSVGVQMTPPARAEAGEYEFTVRVNSAKAKSEVKLKVILTGTYAIKVGTTEGLLSLSTQKGKPATMSLYVRNEGSAAQKEVTFLSFKPESWKVEFTPEKVENLKAGDFAQVEVKITPSEDALVGDYSVALNAQGEKSDDDLELRITVKASSAWGWVGIGIIILVIILLAISFKVLGRR